MRTPWPCMKKKNSDKNSLNWPCETGRHAGAFFACLHLLAIQSFQ